MGSPVLRDPSAMTDADLRAEFQALEAAADRASLPDPAVFLRRVVPGYRYRPHLKVITHQLQRIASKEIDRLLIKMPPQTGKTLTAVVGGSVWWLANHKTDRVVIGSYGDSLAVDRGRESKKLVEDSGHRFGLHIARGLAQVQDWQTTTGGGVRSVGIGTGITGRRGDIAFIDDPHKSREEADNVRFRDRAYRWLSADIISRLSPGAPVVMIMTPWHPDDLAARVTADEGTTDQGGRWQVIRMPAFCDDPDHDPIGRSAGEPIPHPRIRVSDKAAAAAHWQDKRRSSTTQDWHSLYMCNPQPAEGALLERKLLRERRCYTTGGCETRATRAAVAVDPSGGGRDTAGIIGGYLGVDKRLYLTHDMSGHMASDAWARAACTLAVDTDADLIIVEKNFGGDMATLTVRTAWSALQREERNTAREAIIATDPLLPVREVERRIDQMDLRYARLCPRIKAVSARKNKVLRAAPVAQQWVEDRVRTAAYLPEVEEEWCIAGGELVSTRRGLVPIELVRVGDQVVTRFGWRSVMWSGQTGVKETLAITMSDGRTLRCTGNHELWVDGKGWTRADEVEKSDRMITWCERKPETTSISEEIGTIWQKMGTTREVPLKASESNIGYSTVQYGPPATDKYHPDTSSGIGMAISPTTTSAISWPSPTVRPDDGSNSKASASTVDQTATTRELSRSTGNAYFTEPSGQLTTAQSLTESTSTTKTRTVPTTTSTTSEPWQKGSTYADTRPSPSERQRRTPQQDRKDGVTNGRGVNRGQSSALNVECPTRQSDRGPSTAQQPAGIGIVTVARVAKGDRLPVYDLTVDKNHEFFANGILVHNCTWQEGSSDSPGRIDASVYLAYALLPLPKGGSGGAAAPGGGSLPTTGTSPLDRGGNSGGGFGPLGR